MSTATATLPRNLPGTLEAPEPTVPARDLLRTVADIIADIDTNNEAWAHIGWHVTALVDLARRAIDATGSPIAFGEDVPPQLRLRDLARAAQDAVGTVDGLVVADDASTHLTVLETLVRR